LVLRDAFGSVQLILNDDALWDRLKDISLESVLEVSGHVRSRPAAQVNPKMETGEIEVRFLFRGAIFISRCDFYFILYL
jgi:aspartyl-tRNA synthetase